MLLSYLWKIPHLMDLVERKYLPPTMETKKCQMFA